MAQPRFNSFFAIFVLKKLVGMAGISWEKEVILRYYCEFKVYFIELVFKNLLYEGSRCELASLLPTHVPLSLGMWA